MSLVTTSGHRPAERSRGTSASIRAVLPEPTGPPIPTRGTPGGRGVPANERSSWECVWLTATPGSSCEQAKLGLLVTHRHDVVQRGAGRDQVDVAGGGALGGGGQHGADAM